MIKSSEFRLVACIWVFLLMSSYTERQSIAQHSLSTLFDTPNTETELKTEPIRPIPYPAPLNEKEIKLGEDLFKDRRLERFGRLSCADCHNLSLGGTDGKAQAVRPDGNSTAYNTPTIFNVKYNTSYYWSARFTSLDQQIDDALSELNTNWQQLVNTISGITYYQKKFRETYTAGISRENVKRALIAYELSLVTPNSRFDRYLRGDHKALTIEEKNGYKLFKNYGCISCHQGINIGGNLVLSESTTGDGFKSQAISNILGLNNVISLQQFNQKRIRVPSLRNVSLTAPYFHDGSVNTLELAIAKMARNQIGIVLPQSDIKQITRFLRSLTGEYNGNPL